MTPRLTLAAAARVLTWTEEATVPPAPTIRSVDHALVAARALAAQGRHVHLAYSGGSHCVSGSCTPPLLDGLIGTQETRR